MMSKRKKQDNGNPLKNKWEKHSLFIESPILRPYLPRTDLFSKRQVYRYVDAHKRVYLKPVDGKGGDGIIKVTRRGTRFEVRYLTIKRMIRSKKRLYHALTRKIGNRSYLVQEGVNLMTIRGRPVDFRILLLKPKHQWKYMGTIGKIAAKHKIITNRHGGGKAINLKKALKAGLDVTDVEYGIIRWELKELSTRVSEIVSLRYKRSRRLGIDVAIDKDKRIWILEVNMYPGYQLFRKHKNSALFSRIRRYMTAIKRKRRR
jgi:glutathione synthase/RimK-type ligase-like ATP-grasp enzyme